jgi:hypothetical protein
VNEEGEAKNDKRDSEELHMRHLSARTHVGCAHVGANPSPPADPAHVRFGATEPSCGR